MQLNWIIKKFWLHHLFFWVLVALVWYYLRYQDYSSSSRAWTVTLIKTADLALLIYLSNYLLIPKLLYRKRYGLFITSFVVMILVSSILKMILIGYLIQNAALLNWSGNIKARIYDNVIPHFFLVIAGVAIKFLFDYISLQKKLMEVAREQAETELNFLKSQINPHFLFNSLNAVYFLIDKNNSEARAALHKFSEMLRYQLYELKGDKITIEKEIGFIRDYISLQQLRKENCKVELHVDEKLHSFDIEPLLLIPFVENSFKHLSHYNQGKPNEVRINLEKTEDEVVFGVRNTTEGKTIEMEHNGGIGLANVKRRLELLYPSRHKLKVAESEGWYDVELTLKINTT